MHFVFLNKTILSFSWHYCYYRRTGRKVLCVCCTCQLLFFRQCNIHKFNLLITWKREKKSEHITTTIISSSSPSFAYIFFSYHRRMQNRHHFDHHWANIIKTNWVKNSAKNGEKKPEEESSHFEKIVMWFNATRYNINGLVNIKSSRLIHAI